MKRASVVAFAVLMPLGQAFGWGSEGHSIVAEIAQRRLNDAAAAAVGKLLDKASLASVASWADDIRNDNGATFNWHFVDIPINSDVLDRARDCKSDPRGDCIVAELERLRNELRCGADDVAKRDALKFAVHFVGDIHQPLHTVLEDLGGNGIPVTVTMLGFTGKKDDPPQPDNLHTVWDTTLIRKTVFAWGSYVTRLENGWLTSAEAKAVDKSKPADWAVQTHAAAQTVWALTPANKTLDDDYFNKTLPIVERQLGIAGLRLARFLNDAYGSTECPVK
jgi:hypothetical protein